MAMNNSDALQAIVESVQRHGDTPLSREIRGILAEANYEVGPPQSDEAADSSAGAFDVEADEAGSDVPPQVRRLIAAAQGWTDYQEPSCLEEQSTDAALRAQADEARQELLNAVSELGEM
jgi:hypothetical protein